MRNKLLILTTLTSALAANALTLDEVRARLADIGCLYGKARFEVLMPSASEPVVYNIDLTVMTPGDSLAPCNYVIEWQLPRGGRVSTGFSSYNAGDHFRYRDTRLQEYHHADDPIPFNTPGGGVQGKAQFVDLLPPFIAGKLAEMAADSTYMSTYNESSTTLKGVRRVNGNDVYEYSYRFDPERGLPLQSDFEYNPGSISEQTVSVSYTWYKAAPCPTLDEAYMVERFGDAFEKFRTSTFRVENMRGAAMPTFSYAAANQRRQHNRGEADLPAPLLIVFADASVVSTPQAINAVRTATSSLPMALATVYAFADNNAPEGFVAGDGEYTMHRPQGIVRKCGVTAYPTFLLVGSDGVVADVLVGMDADLETRLEQSLMLLE